MAQPQEAFRISETDEAAHKIILGLIYANLLVLVGGGVGSFLMARRALKPIEEAHEAQSRFTSDASHELRTPLAAMKAEIEVTLRDTASSKSELREVLSSNLEEIEKLSRLAEMLLNLSRLDHDKLERTAVNIPALTKEVIRMYNQPSSRITVSSPKSIPAVVGNKSAIHELLSILIDNALKYSPADSLIAVTISKHSKSVRFEITNTGPGIAAAKLPHIFDRFYRGDTSRTHSASKGYGLGLSLAKKIVELHDGELSVTSTPNAATIFTVLLPSFQKHSSKSIS
jgi:signal transduction histidine kinase